MFPTLFVALLLAAAVALLAELASRARSTSSRAREALIRVRSTLIRARKAPKPTVIQQAIHHPDGYIYVIREHAIPTNCPDYDTFRVYEGRVYIKGEPDPIGWPGLDRPLVRPCRARALRDCEHLHKTHKEVTASADALKAFAYTGSLVLPKTPES